MDQVLSIVTSFVFWGGVLAGWVLAPVINKLVAKFKKNK